MKWEDINVHQFQEIYKLIQKNDSDEFELTEKIVAVANNLTEKEVEELPMSKFRELKDGISFLINGSPIPGKAPKYIRTGLKKYRLQYDPTKITMGQYIDILSLSESPIENMHLILASLIRKKPSGIFKWFKPQYDSVEDMNRIADNMLNAKVVDVYHACVFFCKVFTGSIRAIRAYLENEMIAKGMEREKVQTLLNNSISVMDGCIMPNLLQSSKGLK